MFGFLSKAKKKNITFRGPFKRRKKEKIKKLERFET